MVREIVSAATGKNIRDILAAEILDPLGFRWTNYGVSPHDVDSVAPSHATGKRSLVPSLARAGVAIGAEGLVVEVHPNPEDALSDGAQSLYPDQFTQLMREVRIIAEAIGRLKHLKAHGPSEYAFGWQDVASAKLWRSARCA